MTGTTTQVTPWTVNGGTLSVNGSIASSSLTTVNAGGTLGGNGTVGNTTINGGTLAPGNSIGLLTVQGNLVFTAAASYMVEVSPANADRTNVTGTATLGGATVKRTSPPGAYVAKQYTIVNATGGVHRHVQRAWSTPTCRRGFTVEPELRRQQRLFESGTELRTARISQRPQRQPAATSPMR